MSGGQKLYKMQAHRLKRLIDLAGLQAAGETPAVCMASLNITRKQHEQDCGLLEIFGSKRIERELETRNGLPVKGKALRPCVDMHLGRDEEGKSCVVTCGTLSAEQYCPKHRGRPIIANSLGRLPRGEFA